MSYRFTITACDGTHTRVFKTEANALRKMAAHLGIKPAAYAAFLVADKSYYDDFGSRCYVEELPRSVRTARQSEALREAYDARECGIATKRQLALLERNYF